MRPIWRTSGCGSARPATARASSSQGGSTRGDPRRRLAAGREEARETQDLAAGERRIAALEPIDELRQALSEPRHQRRFETQAPDLLVTRAPPAELTLLPRRFEGAKDRCAEVGPRLGGEEREEGVELERETRRRRGDWQGWQGSRGGRVWGRRDFIAEKTEAGSGSPRPRSVERKQAA